MKVSRSSKPTVVRIHEVVIDEAVHDSSAEREIFFRLTSWAPFLGADLIRLDDRECMVSEGVLKESLFRKLPIENFWEMIVPGDEDK